MGAWIAENWQWLIGDGVVVLILGAIAAGAKYAWGRYRALLKESTALTDQLKRKRLAEALLKDELVAANYAVENCEDFVTYADALAKTIAELHSTRHGHNDYASLLLHGFGDLVSKSVANGAPERLAKALRSAQRLIRDGLEYKPTPFEALQGAAPSVAVPGRNFDVEGIRREVGLAAEAARAWLADCRRRAQ